MVFEKKAKRLHLMLSTGSGNTSEIENQIAHISVTDANNQSRAISSSADAYARVGGTGLNKHLKNSIKGTDVIIKGDQEQDDGLVEADDNYEEYFYRD